MRLKLGWVPRLLSILFIIAIFVCINVIWTTSSLFHLTHKSLLNANRSRLSFDSVLDASNISGKTDAIRLALANNDLKFREAGYFSTNTTSLTGAGSIVQRPDLFLTTLQLGQLGNNMFQYAGLLGLARLNGRTPFFPVSSLVRQVFKITRVATIKEASTWRRVSEAHYGTYEAAFEHLPESNLTLAAYLQSYKYFQALEKEVRQEFQFREGIQRRAMGLIKLLRPRIGTRTPIGVHVRRYDLLTHKEIRLGSLAAPKAYFQQAFAWMRSRHGDVVFLVATDDPTWCKQNILGGDDVILLPHSTADVHLCALATCRHVIMSVGTFGWWAGWLGGGDVIYYTKPVVPGSWRDKGFNRQDFFPLHWIGLGDGESPEPSPQMGQAQNLSSSLIGQTSQQQMGQGRILGNSLTPQSSQQMGQGGMLGNNVIPQSPQQMGSAGILGNSLIVQTSQEMGQGGNLGNNVVPQFSQQMGQGGILGNNLLPQSSQQMGQGEILGNNLLPQSPQQMGQGGILGNNLLPQSPQQTNAESFGKSQAPLGVIGGGTNLGIRTSLGDGGLPGQLESAAQDQSIADLGSLSAQMPQNIILNKASLDGMYLSKQMGDLSSQDMTKTSQNSGVFQGIAEPASLARTSPIAMGPSVDGNIPVNNARLISETGNSPNLLETPVSGQGLPNLVESDTLKGNFQNTPGPNAPSSASLNPMEPRVNQNNPQGTVVQDQVTNAVSKSPTQQGNIILPDAVTAQQSDSAADPLLTMKSNAGSIFSSSDTTDTAIGDKSLTDSGKVTPNLALFPPDGAASSKTTPEGGLVSAPGGVAGQSTMDKGSPSTLAKEEAINNKDVTAD